MTKPIYILYEYDQYVGEGTLSELAQAVNRSEITIRKAQYPSYLGKAKRWYAVRVRSKSEQRLPIGKVKIDVIQGLVKLNDYSYAEISRLMEINYSTLWSKLNKLSTFTLDEVEFFEDLFYLEKGELVVD